MDLSQLGSFKPSNVDPEAIGKAISRVNTGRAILFTGAGFSSGSRNILRKTPPLAKELAKLIAKKGGLEEDDDLSYVSDYFLNNKEKSELLHLLKENFTIVENEDYHREISSLGWKRIYTTNYDDLIEKSAADSKKTIYSLTVEDSPAEFYKKDDCCIHINGSISSVSEEDLNSKFKLTRTSYVSHDSFVNSPWYYYFKKDLEQCSAIIFIGYSLYDIDIEKLLFLSPTLREKTYFVIGKEPSKKELYMLSKYGCVFPIGIDGFSDHVKKRPVNTEHNDEFWLDSFEEYQLSDPKTAISDDQIMSFILYGELEDPYIDNAMSSDQSKPYLVVRECIQQVESLLKKSKFIAILGDFGNGKSILLQEIMSRFSMIGTKVYSLQNSDGDFFGDIQKIDKRQGDALLIIDDYSLNIEVLTYISKFNSKNIRVLFSDRTNNHDRLRGRLSDENLEYSEINTDILHKREIESFVSIIDNLGFWGEKATLSLKRKVEQITHENRSQISHALLNLFNSPQIKKRIDVLLQPILCNPEYQSTIFSICVLEILNLPRYSSLVSEVSGNDFIYKSELRNNPNFNQLFKINGDRITSKSSIFSVSLLNNYFTSSYITDKLLGLVEKYNRLKNNGSTENELFKALLKFSFVERLLPKKNKLNSLLKYYEELKVRVDWLKRDPHFWLQYGMARMSFGKLEQLNKAQSNLDESYVIALGKNAYDTSYIDTQQGRLYLLKSLVQSDGNKIWALFQDAHNLLFRLDDNIYKYRQVMEYKRFFDQKYDCLSKKNKRSFVDAVKQMKVKLEGSCYFLPGNIFPNHTMDICYKYLSKISEDVL